MRRWWPAAFVMVFPACAGEESTETPTLTANSIAFVEVTTEAGLGGFKHERGAQGDFWFPEINGAGVAFIDYDADGWQDLLVAGGGVWDGSGREKVPSVWLYRNEGNGTFSLRTDEAGLANVHDYSYGFAVADYDNDGDQDFLLTTVGLNRLFRNDGGRFAEVGTAAGISDRIEWSNSAAFFDADRDSHLDLFVTNYVQWSPETDIPCLFGAENRKDYCTPHAYRGMPSRYFHNDGDQTFTDQSQEAGFLPSPGKSMGVALLDFNDDGWTDLAVANDGEPDQLYRNEGNGRFSEVGFVSGMALNSRGQPTAGMGIDAGQIDGSGRDAIVVGNFSFENIGVFRYDGNGLFSDISQSSGIGATSLWSLTFGVLLFDADLDGDQDFFAANGHISVHADEDGDPDRFREPPHLYANDGNGRFTDAAPTIESLRTPMLARGVAYADYDRDGDLDLAISENDG
ncbi:MAG TPA: VCBS repeat-containing protein, partial [Rhodothermales bacterium]